MAAEGLRADLVFATNLSNCPLEFLHCAPILSGITIHPSKHI